MRVIDRRAILRLAAVTAVVLVAASAASVAPREEVTLNMTIPSELTQGDLPDDLQAQQSFLDYRKVLQLLDPAAPRALFVAEPALYERLKGAPGIHPVELARRKSLLLFANR